MFYSSTSTYRSHFKSTVKLGVKGELINGILFHKVKKFLTHLLYSLKQVGDSLMSN